MSVFALHARALSTYKDFVRSFVKIADPRLRQFVEEAILGDAGGLWPEPLVQLSPAYEQGATVDELAEEGLLHPTTARVFRRADGSPFRLYRHQVEALRRAREGKSYVLTSGTGSGKSFAYFIPVLDLVARNPGLKGPVALVVYPMNALVNSQLHALEELKERYEARYGGPFPLRFARYTGQTTEDERRAIRENPPHLLLTNYVMGEYLLTRPEDHPLVSPPPSPLPFFLVFDELHTYRGRQGADVALLARRFRARVGERPVVHVGTSATLIAREGATPEERREAVARFASTFFGRDIPPEDVVEECLTPATRGGPPSDEELCAGVRTPVPRHLEAFCAHPLARFVEYALGLKEEGGGYARRKPRPLSEVAAELAERTGLSLEEARGRLEEVLEVGAGLEEAGRPLFAFKLHQFVSQTSAVRASLEGAETREFGREPFAPSGKLLFPLYFCRGCGQDYYAVVKVDGRFLPNEDLVGGEAEAGEVGYLAFVEDFDPENDLPDSWYDKRGRLKKTWEGRAPRLLFVDLEGRIVAEGTPEARPFYYQPAPFSLCLRCGADWTGQEREFTKLTYLGSEGRTSATTVLALSLLRKAREAGEGRDKLLSFTDNRQDASLQAGHFNDFVRTVMVRAALVRALERRGRLDYVDLAQEVVKALPLREFVKNKELKEDSPAMGRVRQVLEDLLRYRLYADLRRGWRFAQPNLEEVGLLEVGYPYAEGEGFLREAAPLFPHLPEEGVLEAVRFFLDHLRRHLAVDSPVLKREGYESLVRRTGEHLDEFWAIDPTTETPVLAASFSPKPGEGEVGFSPRGRAGREFARRFGVVPDADFLERLVALLMAHDLLRKVEPGRYRIPESALEWRRGGGTPRFDPLRFRGGGAREGNRYFARLYQESAEVLARLEAREHTAQVRPEEREVREKRFRGEEEPRLPYLVASPTLELGVDIADLDMVHLRNLPPTPANYAQRVGRAGRQGQPGLVVAFAGAFSHHDRYFFERRGEMVGGSVRPPALELANESLLGAHVHAEWLSATGLALRESLEYTLDINKEDLPLYPEVRERLRLTPERQEALLTHLKKVFAYDWERLSGTGWFGETWLRRTVEEAPLAFDRVLDTWRLLFRAAREMRERGHRLVDSRVREERERGEAMRREAERQLNLLLQRDVAREEGDFYPYRYLASEEFLPGYNLMALPVRAYVPRGEGEYLNRPRDVAITEFAPGNVVYHEGGKWTPVALYAPPGGLRSRLAQVWVCAACRHLAQREKEVCPGCGASLAERGELLQVLDLVGVRTKRRERITANEEERFRGGYRLEVAYEFSGQGRRGAVVLEELRLPLVYASSARVHRINRGHRRSQSEGFYVDLEGGDLLSEEEARKRSGEPGSAVERVALRVQTTQNALLLDLSGLREAEGKGEGDAFLSLAFALKRGMEAHFGVEESELDLVEVAPGRFLYLEDAEGGLGILRRLVEEEGVLAEVVRRALEVLHFSLEGKDEKPECARACYECLLSYSNQRLAPRLHRHRALPLLLQLLSARVEVEGGRGEERLEALLARCQSELERDFLRLLKAKGLPLPDEAQYRIGEAHTVADFFYRPNLLVYVDGPHHDSERQARIDERQRRTLMELGFRVEVLRYEDLEKGVERLRNALAHRAQS